MQDKADRTDRRMIAGLERFKREAERVVAALEAEASGGAVSELQVVATQALMLLGTYAAEYPAAPADSSYRRTGTLGRLWTAATPQVTVGGHVLDARISNATPYGPYVQDRERQARQHRERWQTTDKIVEAHVGEIAPLLARAGYRIVERVAEAAG